MMLTSAVANELLHPIMLQAMDAASEGISISDARLPDQPLIYVNKGFLSMTGYTAEEVLGRNCRFLQGALTNTDAVAKLKTGLKEGKPVRVELINYRKSGIPFWNRLSITPVTNDLGQLTHFIGVQDDITEEKERLALEKRVAAQSLVMKVGIKAQEKERRELGKELHDNVNQLLSTANLYLCTATDQEEMRLSLIEETKALLQQTVQEIRSLSQRMVGPGLHHTTLGESITALLDGMKPALPFVVEFDATGLQEETLSESRRVMFYRIVQEQLTNTIKHAGAKAVAIQLWNQPGAICLRITDDGVGFDEAKHSAGIGLQNIRARLQVEKGHLTLRTAPGRGCNLLAEVPVATPA